MGNDSKLRVGMIGAGSWARQHLQAWQSCEDTEVVSLYNRTRPRGEKLAGEFGISDIFTDPLEVINQDSIDIISISMPHHLHHPLALAAIEAGKHVFCEKPLAMNVPEAKDMWKRSEAAGVKTGMQFGTRLDPLLAKMREMINDGYLGPVEHAEFVMAADWAAMPDFPLVWRFRKDIAGSGALGDMGVYIIDSARWMIGELTAVSGMMKTLVRQRPIIGDEHDFFDVMRLTYKHQLPELPAMGDVNTDDEVLFLAEFETGAAGYFRASRVKTDHHIRIQGPKGMLIRDYQAGKLLGRQGRSIDFSDIPAPPIKPAATMVTQFVSNIKNGTNKGPTFYDGVKAQEVIDAVIESAESKAWVSI